MQSITVINLQALDFWPEWSLEKWRDNTEIGSKEVFPFIA